MNLRTKTTIFFATLFIVVAASVVIYIDSVVGDTTKKQISSDLRIFGEQSEGAYYTFLGNIKGRAIDWSSDLGLQRIVTGLLDTKSGTPERERFAREFATYIIAKKMPYDKTVFLVDVLDKNGIVIASTRHERIGVDELKEEMDFGAHYFSKTVVSNFGSAFVKSIVFEEDETDEPMVHATTRFFSQNNSGDFVPLDAVLMLHFENIQQIADVLSGEWQLQEGAQAGKNFLSSYETSEIYLVNSARIMVTPSRYVSDIVSKQVVDTLPVKECLENGKEILAEYDNYHGVRVLGASVCLKSEGLVLLTEISKEEIFAPLTSLILTTIFGGLGLLVIGIIAVMSFLRLPLRRIDEVIFALEKVVNGDLATKVIVRAKDETGRLATMFNTMIESIRNNQNELLLSERQLKEKSDELGKDVEEHKKQEQFLEESKRAMLNLLEDSWKAKEEIAQEGSKLQTVLSSVADGLVLVDGSYLIELINPSAAHMFGMAEKDLLGQDLRSIITLWNRQKDIISPSSWPTEEAFLTKKIIIGSLDDNFSISTEKHSDKIPIVLSVAPLSSGLDGVVIVFRDAKKDRELDDAKSGFISVASHQLRTPLTSIRWYSEMLLSEDAGLLNDSQKDFMKEIHGGAERLYQTVDLLLGISRVESGKIKSDIVSIDIGVFTNEVVKELRSQIDMKNLSLSVAPSGNEPVVVRLDALTLRQVVINLISNSIRYTNDRGLIEIKWWLGDEGKEVVYMVHDNGIGVPENQRDSVFTKFFRAENARAQVPDGSGLGLALVKDLVMSWGGRIWFESFPGQGTTFFFTIPLTTEVPVEK